MEYSVNHVWTSNILLQFVLVNDVKYSMGINPSQYSSTLVSLGPGAEPVWALAILALLRVAVATLAWQVALASCEGGRADSTLALSQSVLTGAGDTRFRVHLYTTPTIILTSHLRKEYSQRGHKSSVTSSR